MSYIQRKEFNAQELAPWEEKLWSTSDFAQLSGFRDMLGGGMAKLHPATSRIDGDDSGIEGDSKRHGDEARELLEAGFLTNER